MAMSGLWWSLMWVAAGGAVRAVRGFATVGHAHIRGLGTPRPLFVARPLSKVERGCWWRLLRRQAAELVCASRGCSGRLAGRNGGVRKCQREVVSLPRARVSFGGSGPVWVRGSPAGRAAGATMSG